MGERGADGGFYVPGTAAKLGGRGVLERNGGCGCLCRVVASSLFFTILTNK